MIGMFCSPAEPRLTDWMMRFPLFTMKPRSVPVLIRSPCTQHCKCHVYSDNYLRVNHLESIGYLGCIFVIQAEVAQYSLLKYLIKIWNWTRCGLTLLVGHTTVLLRRQDSQANVVVSQGERWWCETHRWGSEESGAEVGGSSIQAPQQQQSWCYHSGPPLQLSPSSS